MYVIMGVMARHKPERTVMLENPKQLIGLLISYTIAENDSVRSGSTSA